MLRLCNFTGQKKNLTVTFAVDGIMDFNGPTSSFVFLLPFFIVETITFAFVIRKSLRSRRASRGVVSASGEPSLNLFRLIVRDNIAYYAV